MSRITTMQEGLFYKVSFFDDVYSEKYVTSLAKYTESKVPPANNEESFYFDVHIIVGKFKNGVVSVYKATGIIEEYATRGEMRRKNAEYFI